MLQLESLSLETTKEFSAESLLPGSLVQEVSIRRLVLQKCVFSSVFNDEPDETKVDQSVCGKTGRLYRDVP